MQNSSTFKGNIEVETIHSLVFGLTTFFVFIGLAVDILTESDLVLWLIFLSSSFLIYLIGFVAKYYPKTVISLTILVLLSIGLYSSFNLFIVAGDFMIPQLISLVIYILTMISINIVTLKTLSSGGTVDLDIKKRKSMKMTTYSKLRRRKSRRNSSRSHNSTSIKSGTYRG